MVINFFGAIVSAAIIKYKSIIMLFLSAQPITGGAPSIAIARATLVQ